MREGANISACPKACRRCARFVDAQQIGDADVAVAADSGWRGQGMRAACQHGAAMCRLPEGSIPNGCFSVTLWGAFES